MPVTTMCFYRSGSQIASLSEEKLTGFVSCLRTSTFLNVGLFSVSEFVQTLECEDMLAYEDTWELPNSMHKKPRSISGRRGCADFLKQPYSPANILMRKKLMGSDSSLESLFASARNEKIKTLKNNEKED